MGNQLPLVSGVIEVPRARTGPRFARPVREDEDGELCNADPTELVPLRWPPQGTDAG